MGANYGVAKIPVETVDEIDAAFELSKASSPMSKVAARKAARAASARAMRVLCRVCVFGIYFHTYLPMTCSYVSPKLTCVVFRARLWHSLKSYARLCAKLPAQMACP